MGCEQFLLWCATLLCYISAVAAQNGGKVKIPVTRFTCQGRVSGYYADVETGCQVYHMCDGLGRQFSYTCPNTTLFQQRMLICDHWYMVNCSKSEGDYDANLLIGQRDKPFVSDADMQLRTPRPDILSVPPNSNYYDGLREAESKFPVHPGNSIVGVADSISSANNNGLDSAKNNYRPPTSWSMGTGVNNNNNKNIQSNFNTNTHQHITEHDNVTGAAVNNNNDRNFQPNANTNTHQHITEHDNVAGSAVNNNNDRNFQLNANTNTHQHITEHDHIAGAASQEPEPTFQTTPEDKFNHNTGQPVTPPSQELSPPLPPKTTETPSSEEFDLDIRMKDSSEDPVYNFIKRFDPNSPDSHRTAMTKTEILNLNQHLPTGQVSAEEERTPRKNTNVGKNFNTFDSDNDKNFIDNNRFKTSNTKSFNPTESTLAEKAITEVKGIDTRLLPPKRDYSDQPSTTMGPPIYYDWKWAVPAFDLEPPKESNVTNSTAAPQRREVSGKRPFSDVTRTTPKTVDPVPSNTEYNISSYFIPDYVFPLDKPHPGYDNEDAQTSFQVKVGRPGRASYGENPACPHCHPAYLTPGTCEPCIVKR